MPEPHNGLNNIGDVKAHLVSYLHQLSNQLLETPAVSSSSMCLGSDDGETGMKLVFVTLNWSIYFGVEPVKFQGYTTLYSSARKFLLFLAGILSFRVPKNVPVNF